MLGYNELDITEYTNIQRKKNKGQKKKQKTKYNLQENRYDGPAI